MCIRDSQRLGLFPAGVEHHRRTRFQRRRADQHDVYAVVKAQVVDAAADGLGELRAEGAQQIQRDRVAFVGGDVEHLLSLIHILTNIRNCFIGFPF